MEQRLAELRAREKELEQFSDYTKRRSLFLSWLGQADKCIRKGYLQDRYYHALFEEWMKKAEMLLEGLPIEECKGKIKIKGKKPMTKRQRIQWKNENKQEIRQHRKRIEEKYRKKQGANE